MSEWENGWLGGGGLALSILTVTKRKTVLYAWFEPKRIEFQWRLCTVT